MDTTFLDALASGDPTPGGGGASAYCGALAAALASMVGNLTVGKQRYAAIEPRVREHLAELEELRAQLIALVQADADAFAPLAAAYRMPKDTEAQQREKEEALQQALVGATATPLSIMEACAQVLDDIDFMAHEGSRLAVSDAGVAAVFAKAAMQGAACNVFINTKSLTDEEMARRANEHAVNLMSRYGTLADDIYDYVMGEIR